MGRLLIKTRFAQAYALKNRISVTNLSAHRPDQTYRLARRRRVRRLKLSKSAPMETSTVHNN